VIVEREGSEIYERSMVCEICERFKDHSYL
jgi:hypothetical protein